MNYDPKTDPLNILINIMDRIIKSGNDLQTTLTAIETINTIRKEMTVVTERQNIADKKVDNYTYIIRAVIDRFGHDEVCAMFSDDHIKAIDEITTHSTTEKK